jgi:hypothetical protein
MMKVSYFVYANRLLEKTEWGVDILHRSPKIVETIFFNGFTRFLYRPPFWKMPAFLKGNATLTLRNHFLYQEATSIKRGIKSITLYD